MNIAIVPLIFEETSSLIRYYKEDVHGHPLVYWFLQNISMSKTIDKVYVITNRQSIYELVHSFDFRKIDFHIMVSQKYTTEQLFKDFFSHNPLNNNDVILYLPNITPFLHDHDYNLAVTSFLSSNKISGSKFSK